MIKWLNPITWFKSAAASIVAQKVDETLTIENGKTVLVGAINRAVTLTERVWDDGDCRTYARGFRLAAKALNDLADSVDPDGEEGRKMSVTEFEVLLGDAQAAFGILVDDKWLEGIRASIKDMVNEKLGV